jgi:phage shock protein PspC (stress-responsive transcriptional regulator)
MTNFQTGLKRSTRNRRFLGVCGGIAHEFGWNPTIVRFATVVLTFILPGPSFVVALAYIALGVFLPKSEEF